MTRDEAVEVANQAGRHNLASHIGELHDELDELHAKHGSKRVLKKPVPVVAPSGAGLPEEPLEVVAAAAAPAQPAHSYSPALMLNHEEFDDSDGFEGDDEDTAPEGAALSSATKPDHPDAPKPKSHKKGGR